MTWKRFPNFPSPMKGIQRANKAKLWCLLYVSVNKSFNKWSNCRWFETLWPPCNVTAMLAFLPYSRPRYNLNQCFLVVDFRQIDFYMIIRHVNPPKVKGEKYKGPILVPLSSWHPKSWAHPSSFLHAIWNEVRQYWMHRGRGRCTGHSSC